VIPRRAAAGLGPPRHGAPGLGTDEAGADLY